jgi:glyoxylase-like metal-dependent hydrolase (beta-lactamase superfamily II)
LSSSSTDSSSIPQLPAAVRVIVRGWLNCNQIVLLGSRENVVIDSGYSRHAGNTLALLRQPEHLGAKHVHRVINTHCHSDHMGGNAMLAREYRCRITVPDGEAKHLKPWNPQSLWMSYADQYAEKFEFSDTMRAGDSFTAGGLTWHAYAAPGHDMDALMFWNAKERILISGDALWENGLGVVFPSEAPNEHIAAALATLDHIEKLDPRVVIPGHGAPFSDIAGAIERARGKLQAFAADPVKNARHVVKVMLMFALLDKGKMRVPSLPAYLQRIPAHRDMNERFIKVTFEELAARTVKELVEAGAIKVDGELMMPAIAA